MLKERQKVGCIFVLIVAFDVLIIFSLCVLDSHKIYKIYRNVCAVYLFRLTFTKSSAWSKIYISFQTYTHIRKKSIQPNNKNFI